MTKYLITGGTGFVGSNLVRRLVHEKAGDIFLIVERNADLWRIRDLLAYLNVFSEDLTDSNGINNIVRLVRPNIVFHLASCGGLPSQTDQRKIFDINFYGTVNFLNACKRIGVDCFVNTGSSSEYGIKNCDMNETDLLCPVSDYGVSKAAATQFCLKEAIFNKLPIYTVRPFSVYGEYEMLGRLISTVIIGAIQGTLINLTSKFNVRDFVYVQDIVEIYFKIAHLRPKLSYVFNAGSGVQSTIGDVVDAVESIIGSKLNICWDSSAQRPWEPTTWRADAKLAHSVLDWQATHPLNIGLEKTLKWYKENLHFYVKNYDKTQSFGSESISI